MSVVTKFDIGDTVRCRATFTALDTDALTSPDTVTAHVLPPSGTAALVSVTEVSAGVWDALVAPDEPGTWTVRIVGVGTVDAAVERTFRVRESAFA